MTRKLNSLEKSQFFEFSSVNKEFHASNNLSLSQGTDHADKN
jgi:hypothetical protein